MSRIQGIFEALRAKQRCGLIPFITAGDPDPQMALPLLRALASNGADLIELGVPCVDPAADGLSIRRAHERALRHGMDLRGVLDLVREFRAQDRRTPLILMGYAEALQAYGANCIDDAGRAGIDGMLIVDHPPERSPEFASRLRAAGMDPIFLLASSATDQCVGEVAALASGFVYCASRQGVTGSASPDFEELGRRLPAIRARVGVPVGVGFGIRDAASAARIAVLADAVVIGSRIAEEIENSPRDLASARVGRFVHGIRMAIDAARKGGGAP